MSTRAAAGVVFTCSPDGRITSILRDDLGVESLEVGRTFTVVVDRGSMQKALRFLMELKSVGATYDVQLTVRAGEEMVPLYFSGGQAADAFVVIGSPAAHRFESLLGELMSMNNHYVNAMREQVRTEMRDERSGRDRQALEDLGALNNELANLQRELNQRNHELERLSKQLELEKSRADALLFNVLPEPVAERLKAGEERIADGFDEATVLFSDLVGFTKMAATMAPRQVVEMLDTVFSALDDMADRFGVQKVKTIGDGYMAACGLPERITDHVERMAEFALAMIAFIQRFTGPHGQPLALRVGIHTGPVVAGVIGKRRLLYDLWGDTVNVASRLESTGETNGIHVSREVVEALGTRFRFSPRGAVEIKGRGSMDTWFLTGRGDG